MLAVAPGIEVIGAASDGAQAVELLQKHGPNVVLMDLNMPGVNGIQATCMIRDKYLDVRVLVLTTYDADE